MTTIAAEADEPSGRDARGDDTSSAAGDRGDSASQASTRARLLANLADIDGHIEFVEGLLARRVFDGEERERVQEGLERVRRRQADPTVTMAVVGEFSVGKSSFINALLREELFETDAVQGTTTAPAVISYGSDSTPCLQCESRADFRVIQRPSDFLRMGVRIMDTPGTGSQAQWHDEVTRRAIRDEADACIVLVPAVEPLSQTLRDFLRENLSDQLSSCVFVLTKIDLVRPRDRERVTSYVRAALESEFGLADALVLPYCSLREEHGLDEENRRTEEQLVDYLRERRIKLQLQSCLTLLCRVLAALDQEMAHRTSERQREHDRLVAATTRDLGPFMEEHKGSVLASFQERVEKERTGIKEEFARLTARELDVAEHELDACASQAQIRTYLSQGIGDSLRSRGARLLDALRDETGELRFFGSIRHIAQDERRRFERDFLSQYSSLDALSQEMDMPVRISFALDERAGSGEDIDPALLQLALENSSADAESFVGGIAGGAAAGALLGSVVPGIGNIVGAAAGGVMGYLGWNRSMTSPKQVARFRDEVRERVKETERAYFSALRAGVLKGFASLANEAWHALDQLIDAYRLSYGHTVDAMRERDLAEQARLEDELALMRLDRELVEGRVELIRRTRMRIQEL